MLLRNQALTNDIRCESGSERCHPLVYSAKAVPKPVFLRLQGRNRPFEQCHNHVGEAMKRTTYTRAEVSSHPKLARTVLDHSSPEVAECNANREGSHGGKMCKLDELKLSSGSALSEGERTLTWE